MRLLMCLAADTRLTADPEIVRLIPARSSTHEIFSTVIFLLLIQEGLLSVTNESMCTKYWLTV